MQKVSANPALPFERTSLWQTALGGSHTETETVTRAFYATHLRDLREKVRALVDRIRADIPYLTVHDLTHLDALWEVASLLAGRTYSLTAAEGYVFGAAVLLHDAAMCLAAFSNGLADLQNTDEWRDTVARLAKEDQNTGTIQNQGVSAESSLVERAIPIVLRLIHARRAEELPLTRWTNTAGKSEYLIDNEDLRAFYGRLIGRIARSHGEALSDVQAALQTNLGPMPSYDGGEVSPLKLACLLRAADAAHIDARRAPRFEKTIVNPRGVPDFHWTFQGKLAKAQAKGDTLVYTSGSSFSLQEADAWWLCFETICMIDSELHQVDQILDVVGLPAIRVKRVEGADSPAAFERLVHTEGWKPVDAHLRVSDVARLVKMFGGEKLYGTDKTAAIRELMQNSADAIMARNHIQIEFANKSSGAITVRLEKQGDIYTLEVQDNGLGMSERTLTDTLLDFGKSFWFSEAVQREFPGLLATGMSPTGKFGIGFFSVFMLGEHVQVISRRYDAGLSTTRVLEFRRGLSLRPILREANARESINDGGTRVTVRLASSPYADGGFLYIKNWLGEVESKDFGTLIAALCPTSEANLFVSADDHTVCAVRSNDWRRIKNSKLLSRIGANYSGHPESTSLMRPVKLGRKVYGRACIRAGEPFSNTGVITVGGLSAMKLDFIDGVLLGTTDVLARNRAVPTAPKAALAKWATEQADLLARSKVPDEEKLMAAGIVVSLGGDPGRLPVARIDGDYLSSAQLARVVKSSSELSVFEGEPEFDSDTDDCHPREFGTFQPARDILFLGKISSWRFEGFWAEQKMSYWRILNPLLTRYWKDREKKSLDKTVGYVGDYDIRREVSIVSRL